MRPHLGGVFIAGTIASLLTSPVAPAVASGPVEPPPVAPTPEVSTPAALKGQLDALLHTSTPAGATVGVAVIDLADRKIVYRQNGDVPLNPASNAKLVTTVAALALLGPEYRYATIAYAEKDAFEGATLRGDIYLRGSGDPSLTTADLYAMAMGLHARGLRHITGGVVVDATRFDRDELPPGYDQKDEFASYRAPVGATSINYNTFTLHVRPGPSAGTSALTWLEPRYSQIELNPQVRTVEGRGRRVLPKLEPTDPPAIELSITGDIGVDASPASFRFPIHDPSRYAGETFRTQLRQAGIRVDRAAIKFGTTPADAQPLQFHHSDSLAILIQSVNKFSNNFMAEQILKTLAPQDAPATFAAALARVRTFMRDAKIPSPGLHIGNGSGLYDTNRITAEQLAFLLHTAYRDFRYSSEFVASLAIMGTDGTIRSRLSESAARRFVRAKTGTLDGVSSLSGYAGAVGKQPVAFAILVNGLRREDAAAARELQNRMTEVIAAFAAARQVPRQSAAPQKR